MKQVVVLFLAILFSVPNTMAQSKVDDSGKMEIKVDPASKARIKFIEDFYDFGSIPLDAIIAHDFPIKNEGTDTLIITAVKPTCGCTTAPMETDHIAPGEVENLHVQLNTKKLHGLVRKFINIECSDPINPYMRISFSAVINDPKQVIVPVPNTADFGNVLKGEKKSLSIELKNTSASNMDLTMFSLPDENLFAIESNKTSLKAGESAEIKFDLSDKLSPGPIAASVSVEAVGKPDTRITIPITGTVVE